MLGLETTPTMAEKARSNIEIAGIDHAQIVDGNAVEIPLDDESVDVVTSNGVLNLVADKVKAFSESSRRKTS